MFDYCHRHRTPRGLLSRTEDFGEGGRSLIRDWGALSRLAAIVIKLVVHVMAAYLRHKCHMLNGLSPHCFYTRFIEFVYGALNANASSD